MPLVTLENLSIRFRGPALFEDVSAIIEPGQRIGLLGRNGAGKTTLLKMLAGDVVPDHGRVVFGQGATVARLVQDVPTDLSGPVGRLVLEACQQQFPEADQWELEHQVESTLSRMELDPEAQFQALSSGLKRRVLLAAALANEPSLLLLDEPTNHLDIDSILWLEGFLSKWRGTFMFITHDRSFLRKLASRIWEIDRGRLFDWSCDYETFLQRKEAALKAEEKQHALFDKKLAEEEAWIRQGIKARRTRNEGRVRALKEMRRVRQERRQGEGTAKLQLQAGERGGTLVAELSKVSFARGDKPIVSDFSTMIMRGDKVGIIGPNGAGKTTLLKLLLGQLTPDRGNVRLGTNLQIAYFDQLRDQLDEEKSVQDNVVEGSDRVRVGDKTKHVIGYLQDFLFSPERARTQVKFLSGGERNRVMLAKLMTRPANVFVLDEPTNDLDSETLELLESQLVDFPGTLLVVSHDRTFLNNIVTSTIVFEDGVINEYVGGYDEWRAAVERRQASDSTKEKEKERRPQPPAVASPAAGKNKAKLSYKESRELEALPTRIETLEAEIAEMHTAMADADYYRRDSAAIAADQEKLADREAELAEAYSRWEELEARA